MQRELHQYERHFYFFIALLLALMVRYALSPLENPDSNAIGIWLEYLRTHNGVFSLGDNFYNYNPPYLYLLALIGYLPQWIPTVFLEKLVSFPFDIFSAVLVAKILLHEKRSYNTALVASIAVLFAPTVLLNSAVWGQCDSLFTSFLLLSTLFILQGHSRFAMASFGIALSFKLQAMLFAPALFWLWIIGTLRFRDFFIIPVVFVFALLPAAFAGKDIPSLLFTYPLQADTFRNITVNAPNLYIWLSDADLVRWTPDSFFFSLKSAAYMLTISFILFIAGYLRLNRNSISQHNIIVLSCVSVLITPYVLPMMHERYFYTADVFSILIAFLIPSLFVIPLLLQGASCITYLNFLIPQPFLSAEDMHIRTLIASILIGIAIIILVRNIFFSERIKTSPEASIEVPCVFNNSKFLWVTTLSLLFCHALALCITQHPSFRASRLGIPIVDLKSPPIIGKAHAKLGSFLSHENIYASRYSQSWGLPRFDSDLRGFPLIIRGAQPRKALCVHAESHITFPLQKKFKSFSGNIAFPDYIQPTDISSVQYKIMGDEKTLWESSIEKPLSSSFSSFNVDVSNVESLELVVTDAGDGIGYDHACWVNVGLTPN